MSRLSLLAALFIALGFAASARAETVKLEEHVLGKADAPVTVDEYVSLTCSHCAQFYNETLPQIEKDYVETGKVKFILHDFPLDGVALKASAIARCMPTDQFYPYVKVLFKNQAAWAVAKEPEKVLVQYAKLGGLPEDKAKACLNDTKLQDAIVAERNEATEKAGIDATPAFIISGKDKAQSEKIQGAQPLSKYTQIFDSMLNEKKK